LPESIDASERMVDNWTRQVQERAEKYQAMAARFEGTTVTERSADGTVELTVNAKGMLTDLKLAEAAGEKRMAEVSAQVMRTLQKAQSRIPELLQEAMAETIGLEDAAATKMFDDAKKTFPEPPEDDEPQPADDALRFDPADEPAARPTPPPPPPSPSPSPQAQPPRRRGRRDDDDDDMGDSIYS
jgi:DNA-binding protein YbaB